MFSPIADIRVIQKGNNRDVDTVLSSKIAQEITIQAKNIITDSVNTIQLKTNESQSEEIAMAIFRIISTCETQLSKTKFVNIPDILITILDSLNQDYGLFIVYQGFTRTEDNQRNQYILKRELSFYTLGLIDLVPIKSSAAMVCFIIDRKNKKVRHYLKSLSADRDPTVPLTIKSMVYHSLMSYFQVEK
jgi:hypothetical protein